MKLWVAPAAERITSADVIVRSAAAAADTDKVIADSEFTVNVIELEVAAVVTEKDPLLVAELNLIQQDHMKVTRNR